MSQYPLTSSPLPSPSPSPSPSSYRSVIPDYAEKWPKLDKSHQFVQLHERFWGIPLEKHSNSLSQNESMDVDVDQETGTDDVDVDQETGTDDEDEEIKYGNFILNVGISGRGHRIYVRKEFIRFYNICKKHLEFASETMQAPSVVITGQPGIGKTCWLYYALCQCLSEKKPVILYNNSTRFLFVEEGVYFETPSFLSIDFKTRVWTLVDADENAIGIPSHLIANLTQHLIIFTTSPKPSRWHPLTKTTSAAVVIMNPWTRKEILQASVIHGLGHRQADVCRAYDQYGPTPRICFDFVLWKASMANHKASFRLAYNNLSLRTLENFFTAFTKNDRGLDDMSHTLFLVRRATKDRIRATDVEFDGVSEYTQGSIEPITQTVEKELREHVKRLSLSEQIKWYNRFEGVPMGRISAGFVYESIVHTIFLKNITLDLFRMTVARAFDKSDKRKPQWKSNYEGASVQSSFKGFRPTRTTIYKESILTLTTIEPEVHYIPEDRNQVGFDSFIITDHTLYIFQVTIASSHKIKPGLVQFFSKISEESLPPHMPWKFVFVRPNNEEISCPQPTDSDLMEKLESGMELFSAVLDLAAPGDS